MPLQPPDCAFRTTQSATDTHAHPPTHTNTTTPPPNQKHTNHEPHASNHTHTRTTQTPTTHSPPPTHNVIDKLSLGDKWMPCVVISCHNLPVSRLRNVRACCLPWRWPPFLRRNRQIHRHKRSAIYHESSRTRPKEERKCGAVWCSAVLLYCCVPCDVVCVCVCVGLLLCACAV